MLYAATAPFFLEKSMEKSREKGRAAVCERLRQDKPAWAAVRWCQRARAHHHSRCPLSFSLFASLRLLSINHHIHAFVLQGSACLVGYLLVGSLFALPL